MPPFVSRIQHWIAAPGEPGEDSLGCLAQPIESSASTKSSLHGQTPQVGNARSGVRKDTINVLPSQTVELTFQANNPGDRMVHCHYSYHLEAGMATVLSYVS